MIGTFPGAEAEALLREQAARRISPSLTLLPKGPTVNLTTASIIATRITPAESRAMAVRRHGEAAVAANEADVARRFGRPDRTRPFHPVTNSG